MAKMAAAISVLLAASLLITGAVAARERFTNEEEAAIVGRQLKDASGSVKGNAQASGDFSQSFSTGATFADSNPYASVSAGGGASGAVSVKDGKPSISESIGSGYSASFLGQSQSRAQSSSSSNNNPGTSSSLGVQFGSSNGNAASSAGANSATQAG